MNQLQLNSQEVAQQFLGILPKRMHKILEMRFGLCGTGEQMTLEAIGNKYGITRERVRQVEADAFSRIRKSPLMDTLSGVFIGIEEYLKANGGVVNERVLLETMAPRPRHQNYVYFLMALNSKALVHVNENDAYHARWTHSQSAENNAHKTISHATEELRKIGKPVSETKLYEILSASSLSALGSAVPQTALAHWLGISKAIAQNHFGEWGLVEFPTIKPRGVRDLSYLVMSKTQKPMHFSDVAKAISAATGKKTHIQTVHNELIKDDRFVLVGRGLYALSEWGYESGTVRDIITKILHEKSSLSKNEIIAAVAERRFVKPNTIVVNLDNRRYFKKLPDGRYATR